MDISPYKRGNWLKASDVKTGDTIIFRDKGIEVEGYSGKPAIEFLIELSDGSEIKMTPNRPSISALAEVLGDETKNWVGKRAIVEVRTDIIEGKDIDVIYLTPDSDSDDIPVVGGKAQDDTEEANEEASMASKK